MRVNEKRQYHRYAKPERLERENIHEVIFFSKFPEIWLKITLLT